MTRVHDRALLDILEAEGGVAFEATAWRVAWASRQALQGSWGGGRWNPPDSFEAIYCSTDLDGAVAEVYYHLSQQPVQSSAEKLLYRLNLRCRNTLKLTPSALVHLGLGPQPLALTDTKRSQEVGAAAHLLAYDSLLVPSARWRCSNLVLLGEHFDISSASVEETTPINFPAWREQHSANFEAIQHEIRQERVRLSKPET